MDFETYPERGKGARGKGVRDVRPSSRGDTGSRYLLSVTLSSGRRGWDKEDSSGTTSVHPRGRRVEPRPEKGHPETETPSRGEVVEGKDEEGLYGKGLLAETRAGRLEGLVTVWRPPRITLERTC